MKATILTVISALLTLFVFGQGTMILGINNKISIEYPSDWVQRDVTGYILLVSEPAGKGWTFMSTFDVQEDTTFKTLDAYFNNYNKTMSSDKTFKNFKITSKGNISFKGFSAIEMHCTAKAKDLPVEWKSIIFLKENRIYKLTATFEVARFYSLEEKTNSIFDSFNIK